MTRCALANGDRVVATLRNPSALTTFASNYSSPQLLVLKLDVTRPEEIKAALVVERVVAANVGWKSLWKTRGNRRRLRIIIAIAFFSQCVDTQTMLTF